MAIAVEIVHDAAAGHGDQIQSQRRCHIGEALDIVVGDKNLGRDEPLRWHLFGIHAQGHIGNVQKPADGEVVWVICQIRGKFRQCRPRPPLNGVDSVAANRQKTRGCCVPRETVFLLPEAHIGQSQQDAHIRGQSEIDLLELWLELFKLVNGGLTLAVAQQLPRQIGPGAQAAGGIGRLWQGFEVFYSRRVDIGINGGIQILRDLCQASGHALRARGLIEHWRLWGARQCDESHAQYGSHVTAHRAAA